jgi:hypothetical protein
MKAIKRLSPLSVAPILLAACSAAPDAEAPAVGAEAPVERFLAFYFDEYGRGLPGESQLPSLASFLTPETLGLFEAASRGEGCYARKNDYEGPPFIQGDLFSSLFEGGTSATYRPLAREPDAVTFEIEWTHDSPIDESPFVWTDQVFVVKTAAGWRIADFAHLGTWEFMMKGSVSEILGAVAKECSD